MKKIAFLVLLMILSHFCSAQYFIPLFITNIDTMANCPLLLSDSTHDLLYISCVDGSSTGRVFGYRNGSLQNTTYPTSLGAPNLGCTTDSGFIVLNGNNYNTIDSLNYQNCLYGNCNNFLSDVITSKNDTIYFDDNIGANDYVKGIPPSGNVFTIGTATGGSGISDLEFYNGLLYACGTFTSMDGNSACKYICYWNGFNWMPLDNLIQLDTIDGGISGFLKFNALLFMVGGFNLVNGVQTEDIVSYDGTNWTAHPFLGSMGGIQQAVVYKNKIWMYGILYDTLGNWQGFASYDETNFELIENTIPFGGVSSMAVFQDTLFIGGTVYNIGNIIPCHNVVKFVDGSFSSFAPITTKWWYNSSDDGASPVNSAYTYYEVTRDTFVMHTANYHGYNCRKIKQDQHHANGSITPLQPLYVFGDTNKVMYYNSYQGRFVLLYKFDVTVGQQLTYYTPQPQTVSDTTFRVVVDSITQLNIQGTNYKRIWTTPLDGWSFGNDGYVQRLGGLGSMLPKKIADFNNEGPLRCYQDTSLSYQYSTDFGCDYTSVNELGVDSWQLVVFPNPAEGQLIIDNGQLIINKIKITDLLGRVVLKQSVTPAAKKIELNISELSSGVYFIKVFSSQGAVMVKKVVKN